MTLTILNQTGSTKSYLGGAVTVAANGNTTATLAQIFPLSRDAGLIADCYLVNVILSDGVNTYRLYEAVRYLDTIASALGGQVVGYVGQAGPSFAIQVGAVDPSGNVQAGHVNSSNELLIQYSNSYAHITGNSTTTVKSGAGRLHGIMINRNWTGGTITIYDNTAASGTKIATIDMGTPSGGLLTTTGIPSPSLIGPLGLEFSTGLTVVTSGAAANDITVLYK